MSANFTPEDGTGLTDANSYVPLAFADQYFLDRANVAWTGADGDKQSALVRATDYVEGRFRFKGESFLTTQALFFPTYSGKHDPDTGDKTPDAMPPKLLKAICEYAVRALAAALAPDPTVTDSGQKLTASTEKLGPIEETFTYQPGGTTYIFRPYPAADMLLRDLLRSGGGSVIRN